MSQHETDHEDEPGQEDNERWLRRALIAFCIALFSLIVLSIHISMLDVAFATHVYGSSSMLAGATAGLRVAAIDPRTRQHLRSLKLELRLVDPASGADLHVFSGDSGRGETVEATFSLPEQEGAAILIGHLDTPRGTEQFRLEVNLRLEPRPGELRRVATRELLRVDRDGRRPELPRLPDGSRVHPYPSSTMLSSMLPQRVFLWAETDGIGQRGPLRLSRPTELVHTDSWGIAAIKLRSDGRPFYELALEANTADADTELVGAAATSTSTILDVPPSQMLLSLSTYAARPRDSIAVTLESIRGGGWYHFDAWHGDALLAVGARELDRGRCTWELELPRHTGLYHIQAYRPFGAPGQTRDGRALWVGPWSESAVWELARQVRAIPGGPDPLLDWLLDSRPEIPTHKGEQLAELLLSRVLNERVPPSLLYDSGPAKRRNVEARKERLRGLFQLAYILAAAVTFLGVGLLLWRHHLRTRKRVSLLCDDEPVTEQADEPVINPRRLVRIQAALQMTLVLGALLFALYAIYLLLVNLRWSM